MTGHRLADINLSDYSDSAKELLETQKRNWEQCYLGYESLKSVQVKTFEFDGFNIKVQFNPGRLTSTSAKVDTKSINERKCFLCIDNLPPDQKGILYNRHYIILCNPFPIFPEHFTIPAVEHRPQLILNSFKDFLKVSKDLSKRYTVFYNGPKCGASAPDHFHFQAGNKDFMPVVNEYKALKDKYSKVLLTGKDIVISELQDGIRRFILMEGNDAHAIEVYFTRIYKLLEEISSPGEEPLMNIISFYEDMKWKIIIILREKHRPARYFEEGEGKLVFSPASVDLGGVCITPLEKDFLKITKDDLADIFSEVIIGEEKFRKIAEDIAGL